MLGLSTGSVSCPAEARGGDVTLLADTDVWMKFSDFDWTSLNRLTSKCGFWIDCHPVMEHAFDLYARGQVLHKKNKKNSQKSVNKSGLNCMFLVTLLYIIFICYIILSYLCDHLCSNGPQRDGESHRSTLETQDW